VSGPFRFGLQRVLELREEKEKAAATALGEAQQRADAARAAAEQIAAVRSASAAELAAVHGAPRPVGELRQLAFVLDQLDRRVAAAEQAAAERDAEVTQHQDHLTAAFRDRRVLDRLKERHLDAWRVSEVQQDRQTMDAIALTRFANKGK